MNIYKKLKESSEYSDEESGEKENQNSRDKMSQVLSTYDRYCTFV